jgi:hypothetical protein
MGIITHSPPHNLARRSLDCIRTKNEWTALVEQIASLPRSNSDRSLHIHHDWKPPTLAKKGSKPSLQKGTSRYLTEEDLETNVPKTKDDSDIQTTVREGRTIIIGATIEKLIEMLASSGSPPGTSSLFYPNIATSNFQIP